MGTDVLYGPIDSGAIDYYAGPGKDVEEDRRLGRYNSRHRGRRQVGRRKPLRSNILLPSLENDVQPNTVQNCRRGRVLALGIVVICIL